MMRRTSPPKHRHDGTSPLPLGMDWSPPRKWNGRDTVWPHDPRTGWSYCVSIPSWIALPKSNSSSSDPVVYYRVQIGVQSPDGVTATRGVLRRFNDFLKLYSDLKKILPNKGLPSAPPRGLLRMRSRAMLEERRCCLEEWMTKLLSDIDISRSVVVASFLELEAAARSSCLEASQQPSGATPPSTLASSNEFHSTMSSSALVGSPSIKSDYGSDTVYETSELGTPSLDRDESSDPGLEDPAMYEHLADPMESIVSYGVSNIDEGLLMGESVLARLENHRKNKALEKQKRDNGNVYKHSFLALEKGGSRLDAERSGVVVHARKQSNESVGSGMTSNRGSDLSNSWTPNMLTEAALDPVSSEYSRVVGGLGGPEWQSHDGEEILLPADQRSKLDRILTFMQRRLVTVKTDMEDMITRLNQEITVKEYLTTRVKDLEGELEQTKQKGKENLQHALSIEKERVTKMQWDMEELRRKSLEMELRLKSREDEFGAETTSASLQRKDALLQELHDAKEQINTLLEQHDEVEAKSKADIKALVKEVKSLRKSQIDLKQLLQQSLLDKSEVELLLYQERQHNENALASRRKLLEDCEALHSQLQEYSFKFTNEVSSVANSSTMDGVLELLTKSDNRIIELLTAVQSLAQNNDTPSEGDDITHSSLKRADDRLRKILREMMADSAKLRKQVNFVIRSAIKTSNVAACHGTGEESPSVGTMLKGIVETWE